MTGARATRRVTVAATDLPLRPGAGAAPPLVLRHGVGSNAASWGAMLAVLDPRMEAMAWDAPGYGNSTPLTAAWPRAAAYATRLEAAMAAVRPAGYAQAVRALGSGNLLADAPHIRAPTLVAVGAKDVVTSPCQYVSLGHYWSVRPSQR